MLNSVRSGRLAGTSWIERHCGLRTTLVISRCVWIQRVLIPLETRVDSCGTARRAVRWSVEDGVRPPNVEGTL